MANGNFAGGDGTLENPYLIEDAFDLNAVRNNLSAHYKLINDIDLDVSPFNEGEGWNPIGETETTTPNLGEGYSFMGTFDGNGHIIKNLYHNSLKSGIGIFASIAGNAVIKSLKVENISITHGDSNNTDRNYRGGIVGCMGGNSIIRECVVVNGYISGRWQISGISGAMKENSTIKNCYSNVDLNTIVSNSDTNGITEIYDKNANCNIINCYSLSRASKGIVIIREGNVTITNCFWDIDVSGTSDSDGGTGLTTEEMTSIDTFIDAGWHEEISEEGKLIWKLLNNNYPKLWFEISKFNLIKFNNRILTLQNNEWIDTGLNEPLTTDDFYNYGIEGLGLISKEKILELGDSFEVLTYIEDDITPKIALIIPPTKPYRLLDNPSIVTYTEDGEIPILSQTVLASTKVRFLVSKDKFNYQVYRDNEWVTIDKDNILEQGMTKLELESIPQEAWAEWFENEAHKHSFDILMGMYSESPNPIIRGITVNYAENESPIVINAYIEPDTIHNEFATLKAHVKDYEGDKISFKVFIKRAGSDEFIQVSPLEGWYNRSTSDTEITQAFNFPYFNPGENEVKLVVKDERGAEAEWTGRIILSNTDPTITLAYDDFSMRATIGDDDNDMVAYRIAINGELVFDYTDFVPSKTLVNYVFDTSKMKFGEENIITIEVKDTHGGYAKQEFAVIGSYRGLMFKNENGEYFVDDKGEILMDLLFGKTLIGGQTSETKKVILENRHEFPITNVQITPENPNFTKGAVLEISETEMPFTPKDIIKVLEVMPSLGEKDFYVRVKTTREAHQGGYFYIKSTATPVLE